MTVSLFCIPIKSSLYTFLDRYETCCTRISLFVICGKKEESIKENLIKLDSSLASISFRFIKKFDHFLTVLPNDHALLLFYGSCTISFIASAKASVALKASSIVFSVPPIFNNTDCF